MAKLLGILIALFGDFGGALFEGRACEKLRREIGIILTPGQEGLRNLAIAA